MSKEKGSVHVHHLPYAADREEGTCAWLLKTIDPSLRTCVHEGTLGTLFLPLLPSSWADRLRGQARQGCRGRSGVCNRRHSPSPGAQQTSITGRKCVFSWSWTFRPLSTVSFPCFFRAQLARAENWLASPGNSQAGAQQPRWARSQDLSPWDGAQKKQCVPTAIHTSDSLTLYWRYQSIL